MSGCIEALWSAIRFGDGFEMARHNCREHKDEDSCKDEPTLKESMLEAFQKARSACRDVI